MTSQSLRQPLSQAVIQEVAAAENVDPLELDPLYDTIDSEALDSLFDTAEKGPQPVGQIKFQYEGHTVVVTSNGAVLLTDEATTSQPIE